MALCKVIILTKSVLLEIKITTTIIYSLENGQINSLKVTDICEEGETHLKTSVWHLLMN